MMDILIAEALAEKKDISVEEYKYAKSLLEKLEKDPAVSRLRLSDTRKKLDKQVRAQC